MYFKEPLKTNLVLELRSGKHAKITGKLTDRSGGFCVLGMMCRAVDPDGFDERGFFHYQGKINAYVLPENFVRDWTTIGHGDLIDDPQDFSLNEEQSAIASEMFPSVIDDGGDTILLSKINDKGDITFEQLADFIEQYC